jgi:hypothetical protein
MLCHPFVRVVAVVVVLLSLSLCDVEGLPVVIRTHIIPRPRILLRRLGFCHPQYDWFCFANFFRIKGFDNTFVASAG